MPKAKDGDEDQDRAARLAAALRANLARRKAQQAARRQSGTSEKGGKSEA